MKIDMTQQILDMNGEPIVLARKMCPRCKTNILICPSCDKDDSMEYDPLDLREVCRSALVNTFQDDQKIAGDEKFEYFRLALRIVDAEKEVDLIAEEIALIKERIAKRWAILIQGRAWTLLDPKGSR